MSLSALFLSLLGCFASFQGAFSYGGWVGYGNAAQKEIDPQPLDRGQVSYRTC